MANVINLTSADTHQPIRDEGIASEAIKPGSLVEFGGSDDYQKHSTTNGNARKAFALSSGEVGFDSDDITTDIASGDTVPVGIFPRGARVNALLISGTDASTSSDANISKGDPLESAGGQDTGTLQKWGATTDNSNVDSIVGYAREAVDNSGASAGSTARLVIEVA